MSDAITKERSWPVDRARAWLKRHDPRLVLWLHHTESHFRATLRRTTELHDDAIDRVVAEVYGEAPAERATAMPADMADPRADVTHRVTDNGEIVVSFSPVAAPPCGIHVIEPVRMSREDAWELALEIASKHIADPAAEVEPPRPAADIARARDAAWTFARQHAGKLVQDGAVVDSITSLIERDRAASAARIAELEAAVALARRELDGARRYRRDCMNDDVQLQVERACTALDRVKR